MTRKILILVSVSFIFQLSLLAQNKRLITGNVIDLATKEPLPYVTVSLKKQLIGVVTNEAGTFDLYVPMEVTEDTLLVSYLGYKHFLISIALVKEPITIKLEETVVQLEEIIVRPLTPQNYIQMAMRKIKENYPSEPFQTEAYYREKILENKNLIKCDEGVFKTYCQSYTDTVKAQHQLLLFRRAENAQAVSFMRKEIKNKETKDSLNKSNGKESSSIIDVGESFGGPADILKSADLSKNPEAFLDSSEFKNYNYSFAKSSSYNTNELMVIDFVSDGKVHHVREKGKVYIDLMSLAIVKIEVEGAFIIPMVVKPILFLLSIGIKNPHYVKTYEFQQVKGRWYPKSIQENIDIVLTNNHLFRKDERSDFEINQFFVVNDLNIENPLPIPLEKRFTQGKEMEKQIFNDKALTWEGMNIIKK